MSQDQVPDQVPARVAAVPYEMTTLLRAVQRQTPARLLVGHAGPAYRTATQLELRRDHAVALDAVHAEIDVERDLGREFIERWGLFEVATEAKDKTEYLMRPDRGRKLNEAARIRLTEKCPGGAHLQVAIGDGLSATAVIAQVPELLPLLQQRATEVGWTFGQPFLIRHCRVGVLNDIGQLLRPRVIALLIGERPGLATAESLSAYLAFEPRPGHTDANRNLISNIHGRGVSPESAVRRIVDLAAKMQAMGTSGVAVKEDVRMEQEKVIGER